MAIRKAMSKKTDPPAKKQTSAAGPYKTGMKTDRSTGVRKMTKPAAPKAKGGSQFLPKGIPAGNKKKVPASKTKPRTKNTYPGSMEEAFDTAKGAVRKTGQEIHKSMQRGTEWLRKDLGLPKR